MAALAPAAPSFEELLGRPDVAWMGQNTLHLDPPAEVVAAIDESVARREYQLYAPAGGLTRLRELVVADLGLPDAQAWVTNGAVDGLHHTVTTLAPRLSQVVATDPGWPWPARFAQVAGVPTVAVPVYDAASGYKLTAAQLAGVIRERSLVYLIDPLNPLGSRYTRAELEPIVELARATSSWIVHDCTYRHFASGHTLVAELYPERTITTYSFSKWLGLAGLRVGALVASGDLLTELTAVPSNPLGAGIVAQRAALAGLEVRGPWLATVRSVNRRNLEAVEAVVAETGFGEVVVPGSHGNFLAVDVSATGVHAEDACARLMADGVFVRPGTYQSPGFGERFVKVSTTVPEAWVERFAAGWRALAGGAA